MASSEERSNTNDIDSNEAEKNNSSTENNLTRLNGAKINNKLIVNNCSTDNNVMEDVIVKSNEQVNFTDTKSDTSYVMAAENVCNDNVAKIVTAKEQIVPDIKQIINCADVKAINVMLTPDGASSNANHNKSDEIHVGTMIPQETQSADRIDKTIEKSSTSTGKNSTNNNPAERNEKTHDNG